MPGDDDKNIRIPNLKVTAEIKKLQDLLKGKDLLFEKTSRDKANLEAENLNLKNEIQQKASKIQAFDRERILIEEKFQKLNEANKKLITEKDSEIIRLKAQIEEISRSKNSDEHIVKELINTKLQFEELNLHNNIKMQELIETKSNLAIGQEKIRKMTYELENLNKIIADYQFEKAAAKNELDLLRSKFNTSFTAEDMSDYLNSAIDSFNSQVNTVDSTVNYVINGMDIELKAQVYKDDQRRMMLSSADIASKSDNSLSSIKFSIRAVPKL